MTNCRCCVPPNQLIKLDTYMVGQLEDQREKYNTSTQQFAKLVGQFVINQHNNMKSTNTLLEQIECCLSDMSYRYFNNMFQIIKHDIEFRSKCHYDEAKKLVYCSSLDYIQRREIIRQKAEAKYRQITDNLDNVIELFAWPNSRIGCTLENRIPYIKEELTKHKEITDLTISAYMHVISRLIATLIKSQKNIRSEVQRINAIAYRIISKHLRKFSDQMAENIYVQNFCHIASLTNLDISANMRNIQYTKVFDMCDYDEVDTKDYFRHVISRRLGPLKRGLDNLRYHTIIAKTLFEYCDFRRTPLLMSTINDLINYCVGLVNMTDSMVMRNQYIDVYMSLVNIRTDDFYGILCSRLSNLVDCSLGRLIRYSHLELKEKINALVKRAVLDYCKSLS